MGLVAQQHKFNFHIDATSSRPTWAQGISYLCLKTLSPHNSITLGPDRKLI